MWYKVFIAVVCIARIRCKPVEVTAPFYTTEVASETTTPIPESPPTPPHQPGCHYEGKFYPAGTQINQGYDESTNWCWWTFCDSDGNVINADNFNCVSTTAEITTVPETSTPGTTTSWHTTDSTEESTTLPHSDETTSTESSSTLPSDTPTPEPSSTTPVTDDTTPTFECEIVTDDSTTSPTTSSEEDGYITSTDAPSPPETTTMEPPTTIPTTMFGCYHNGEFYPPGSEISRGYDGENWCYGSYCSDDGHVLMWDNWNCGSTTPPMPTTTPPMPTSSPASSTPIPYPSTTDESFPTTTTDSPMHWTREDGGEEDVTTSSPTM